MVGDWKGMECRDTTDAVLQEHLAITDAKALYDAIKAQAAGKEPRIALAIGEIKQSMIAIGLRPRWVPHNVMLADPLTKEVSKSNLTPLMNVKTGMYRMSSEKDEEGYRKEVRESGQTISRLKGKVVDDQALNAFQ